MDTQCLIPVNTGERLKFPLHKPLILFMNNGKIYCCQIKYGGTDFIVVIDLQERIITDIGRVQYIDLQIAEQVTFKRNRIDGFSILKTVSPVNKPIQHTTSSIVSFDNSNRKDKND